MDTAGLSQERSYWDASFYHQMRKRAVCLIKAESSDHTLQAEDLVHDAYLKLSNSPVRVRVNGGKHYFAIASRAMKRSLVDRSRAARAVKRFDHLQRTELVNDAAGSNDPTSESLWVTELIEKCTANGERMGAVAKLHFLEQNSADEIARLLCISERTVKRDLCAATLRLRELY